MNTQILDDLGLTQAETKIYLSLLEIGESTAGPIMQQAELHNSVTHTTLAKLVAKGIVSYIKRGHTKHYSATSPNNLLALIEERKKRLEKIIPELETLQHPTEKQEAEIFEGMQGFKVMLYQLIEDVQDGDEYLFFAFQTENKEDMKEIYDFYNEFEQERRQFGIITKGIAPVANKELVASYRHKQFYFVEYPILSNITIFKNKIAMTSWEDRKVSFLIHSRQLAEMYRKYFYSIWDKSSKKKG